MKIGAVMFFTTGSMQPAPLARVLEERGFESLWVPEHTHIPSTRKTQYPAGGPLIRPYYDIYDPFVALNTAAAVTTHLKIGTGVCLVPQRDPIVTAKLISSLDQISNGRFLFGVGNGWNQDEIENHGTVFKTRHKLGRERIEAMKAIWTSSKAEYHGEFVNFDPMMTWPKPVQKPHPPILVGGAFPYSARRAIRYGDGWMPQVTEYAKQELADVIPLFRKMAIEANRDPDSIPITVWGRGPDVEQMKRYRDLGVDRVATSLDSEKADKILPVLDRWAEVMRAVNG